MKTRQLFTFLILGLGMALVLVWALKGGSAPAVAAPGAGRDIEALNTPADELHVCPSGCTYSSIQDAVDAANDGDVIKVAAGTYTGVHARPRNDITTTGTVTQVVYISKTVTLRGGYAITNWMVSNPDANPTTLDAQGQGRVLYITGDTSPTVEGLRITGGNTRGLGSAGSGIYAITATVTLSSCRVVSNTADGFIMGGAIHLWNSPSTTLRGNVIQGNAGGGIYLSHSPNTTLSGNTIQHNETVDGDGGGVYLEHCDNAVLAGNTIQGNTASGLTTAGGGGVYVTDSDNAVLLDNVIQGNRTGGFYGAGCGGGVLLAGNPNGTLQDNTILGNSAQSGGGVCLASSDSVSLLGNAILNNTAMSRLGGEGGGIALRGSGDVKVSGNTIRSNSGQWGSGLSIWSSENARLDSNVIADSQNLSIGSAVYVRGSTVALRHTTLARNGGSGLYLTHDGYDAYSYSTVALTNTVLVSHTMGITVKGGNTATVNGVLWYENKTNIYGPGTVTVTHQITGSPAFAADGYHLTSASAALDAGVDAGVSADIDGDPRPLGGGYDLGADEVSVLVTKQAYPDPVWPGAQLTYTIHITNVFDAMLHATITDTLPPSVTLEKASGGTLALPGGTVVLPDGREAVVWTDVITAPGGLWMGTIVVTVDEGYAGPLINQVEVTTNEGVAGSDSVTVVASRRIYLPLVLRES